MSKIVRWAYHLLEPIGESFFSLLLFTLRYRKFKAFPLVKGGFEEHRPQAPARDTQHTIIIERLIESYNKAKAEQKNVSRPYRVGHMWQDILDTDFNQLATAFRNKDYVKAQAILDNFNREVCSSKMGGGYDNFFRMKKVPFFKYQFINTWYEYYNIYKELTGNAPRLTYPVVGNPVGLYHEGYIVPPNAIEHRYYAEEMFRLLQGIDNPVICEIGGGIGSQAYMVLSNTGHKLTYILLDIPEVLVLASYFLMASLPGKKVLLYGEAPLDSHTFRQYDVILMPNFTLPQLGDESVHLFFNACSLSEMDSITVEEYIHQIERVSSKYFMHVNHTARFKWHEDGKTITNMMAREIIPDRALFKKIYERPRRFALLPDKVFYFYSKSKHLAFLYEKTKSATQEDTERQTKKPGS